MSDSGRMSPTIDIGPCTVRGPISAVKARVMWENGVLYVVRTSRDVVSVECPQLPRQERGQSQPYVAHTNTGIVRFHRAGCTCSYGLNRTNGFALMDIARPL